MLIPCQQCLSSPTRIEVDKAHAQGRWLDIGIPSIRNVRHLSRQRIKLWVLLALSSLPLHLLCVLVANADDILTDVSSYNSAVFGSVSSNDYLAFSVSDAFLEDAECRNCTGIADPAITVRYGLYSPNNWNDQNLRDVPSVLSNLHHDYKAGSLDRLEPLECLNQYATTIQSNRRNVLLVAKKARFPNMEENTFINNSHVHWGMPFYSTAAASQTEAADAYGWICTGTYSDIEGSCASFLSGLRSTMSAWSIGRNCGIDSRQPCQNSTAYPVEYCLSQPAVPHCRLQFSPAIAIAVTVLNFCKFHCIPVAEAQLRYDRALHRPACLVCHVAPVAKHRPVFRPAQLLQPIGCVSLFANLLVIVKAALMFLIVFRVNDEPLITMGDAAASFLTRHDPTTKNMCLLSIHDVREHGYTTGARQWLDRRYRWKDATSKRRRATTLTM